MPEQVVINSIEFARNGESLSGQVAIESLGRLQDSLFSGEGELAYTLTGKRGENGKLYLVCAVEGVLQLRCQRCLDALAYPASLESELELVADGQDVDEDGLTDAIPADPKLDVLALIEDEVLLGLPMAPMHVPEGCKASAGLDQAGPGKKNAFSALAALKTQNLRK